MLGLPGRRELLAQRADLALERIDAEPRRRLTDDERGLDPALFAARRAHSGLMGRALQHLEPSAARQVVARPVARVRRGQQAALEHGGPARDRRQTGRARPAEREYQQRYRERSSHRLRSFMAGVRLWNLVLRTGREPVHAAALPSAAASPQRPETKRCAGSSRRTTLSGSERSELRNTSA